MIKQILIDDKARANQLEGARIVSEVVGKTLGPRGSNIAIERTYGVPTVIHDGVKVLAQICGDNTFLDNQWHNMGAKTIYSASKESNDYAGDGSTGTAILTYSILSEGHKLVTAGHNARILRRGILTAAEAIDKELVKISTPVKGDQLTQVATISAQDEEIGRSIITALRLVGDGGIVTIDEMGSDLSVDFKEGMRLDSGLLHPVWVTDQQRMEAHLDNPVILVTDYAISEVSQFETMLEQVVGVDKKSQMLIIAKDVSGSALIYLAQNKKQSQLNLVPVKATTTEQLADIATLTGAKLISQANGDDLNEVTLAELGGADRIVVGENTTIIGGHGPEEDIKLRLNYLDEQIKRSDLSGFDIEQLKERRSKLKGGIAVIHVGNDTERREQVLDAISATKAAKEEGILPGGETALLRARKVLEDINLTPEEKHGADIVFKAVEIPFKTLVENAGDESGALLDKVVSGTRGYNVYTREMVDLIQDGVIDPTRVVRSMLRTAAKYATSMLTTDVLVTIKRKDDIPNAS